MGPRTSPEMLRALELIIKEGKSQAEASRATGISKSAISMNKIYRNYVDRQKRRQDNV